MVETLAAERAYDALADRVRVGAWTGVLRLLMPIAAALVAKSAP